MNPATVYLLIRAISGLAMSFTHTSYVPYLLSTLHVTAAEVELMNACFFFTIFAAELPTGMLADGRGRAWSVRMAFIFHGAGLLIYGAATGFWSALLAEAVEGIGFAFMSGACSAWVTDALIHRNESERIGTIFTTDAALTAVVIVIGSQVGHLLSLWSFRAPWIVGGTSQTVGLFIALRYMNGEGEPKQRVTEREAFRLAWAQFRKLPGLRWGAIAGMAFGFVIPFNHFWSPYFRTFVDEAFIGLIWIPLYLSVAASAWFARRRMAEVRRPDMLIAGMLFVAGSSLAMLKLPESLAGAILLAMIHDMARGLFQPQLELFVQRQSESAYRATAGSILSFVHRCGHGVILLGVWFGMRGMDASRASITTLWAWCGSLLAISAMFLFFFRPRILSSDG